MTLLHAHNVATGQHRYYLDGRRVTRDRYHDAHSAAIRAGRLSCSHTVKPFGSTTFKHYASA